MIIVGIFYNLPSFVMMALFQHYPQIDMESMQSVLMMVGPLAILSIIMYLLIELGLIRISLYIRDNKGVYMLNTSTDALTFVEGTGGALKNRMAVVGDKAIVMGNKQLYVIQNVAVIHTVSFESALSGVAKTYDEE